MDENFATNEARFATNLAVIRKEVERSHDDFITEHFRKYNEPELPPVWKTLEAISMGTLSKLYSNFSNATAKHAVAREFGLNHHKFLRSWLECLAVLRNCCAHHSRLSNHVFPVKQRCQNVCQIHGLLISHSENKLFIHNYAVLCIGSTPLFLKIHSLPISSNS